MAALIAVMVVSMGVVLAVSSARQQAQREREQQLLWVGNQYRQALRSYQQAPAPAGAGQYPLTLADLLDDARFAVKTRHLRQLYPDPLTGGNDWVLEKAGGRIVGLHSASTREPVRHAGFAAQDSGFAHARSYADWRFLAVAMAQAPAATPAAPGTVPSTPADGTTAPPPESPSPAQPAPSDPTAEAIAQCYNEFGSTLRLCRGPPFSRGIDRLSCANEYGDLLRLCIAAATQP